MFVWFISIYEKSIFCTKQYNAFEYIKQFYIKNCCKLYKNNIYLDHNYRQFYIFLISWIKS